MSRFPHQANAIKHLKDKLDALSARVSRVVTPAGQLRIESTTIVGGVWAHDHSSAAEAGQVEYTPTVKSDWNGNLDPGNVWQALDQLASRIHQIESVLIGIPVISYPSNTMLFEGME